MFAVQGWKKVHFCQSVLFYFSREKCLVSDQTNCIHVWPCQSRVHFCKVTYHQRAGGFGRAEGVEGATSSRFGNTRSKTIRFSSKIIFSDPRFSDLPTALHLSCRHFCLQTLTWGDIFFEEAFLFSKWILRPTYSFYILSFPSYSWIFWARASLEYEAPGT